MAYDWKAEFRRHLVQPDRNLDQGGHFTLLTGGSVTLKKNTNDVSYDVAAAHNIDVIELFILRAAPTGHETTITGRGSEQAVDYFQWYKWAIKDFHGIKHSYKPRPHQQKEALDVYERIYAYLSEKYAEQLRPAIRKRTSAEDFAAFINHHLCAIIILVGVAIWTALIFFSKSGVIPPQHFFTLIVALHVIGLVFILAISLGTYAFALLFRLGLPKRLARFVLLTLGNKPPSPPTH